MHHRNQDLHGNVPDSSSVALLIIDVINDLEWPGGEQILESATAMAHAIAKLKQRATEVKIPTIYVNDNFGRWQSDFQAVVDHAIEDHTRGEAIVKLLKPGRDDYFVLKPKHSGFFSTTLDTLLDYLNVNTLILTGLQTNICVLFTANEAYMRDLNLIAPRDCSASEKASDHDYAIDQMSRILKADTRNSTELDLAQLLVQMEERNREEKKQGPKKSANKNSEDSTSEDRTSEDKRSNAKGPLSRQEPY